jgi:hypothetical protein
MTQLKGFSANLDLLRSVIEKPLMQVGANVSKRFLASTNRKDMVERQPASLLPADFE